MKLGKKYTIQHMKRMTRREMKPVSVCRTEMMNFLSALQRHDFEESSCQAEARELELCRRQQVMKCQ